MARLLSERNDAFLQMMQELCSLLHIKKKIPKWVDIIVRVRK